MSNFVIISNIKTFIKKKVLHSRKSLHICHYCIVTINYIRLTKIYSQPNNVCDKCFCIYSKTLFQFQVLRREFRDHALFRELR